MSQRDEQKAQIHPSHKLDKPYSDIRCPGSTPRFYTVVKCKNCDAEYIEHSAGFFMDAELKMKCG
jgi:hypothetical protein